MSLRLRLRPHPPPPPLPYHHRPGFAKTRTPREILRLGADALRVKLRVRAIPLWLLPLLGLVSRFMREVADVSFTFDRPYEVDATKFTRRFWSDVTPFEVGAPATARSFAPPPSR